MGLGSLIRINDPATVTLNDSGRSPAFFALRHPAQVDTATIQELREFALREGRNVRLCLHFGPDADFHDMIILEHKGRYYRPHKHPEHGETWHILEGRLGVLGFDDTGKITDATVLERSTNVIYRVGLDCYHAVFPLTDVVIYHESKPGPFLGAGDAVFPEWSPSPDDAAGIKTHAKRMALALEAAATGQARREEPSRHHRGFRFGLPGSGTPVAGTSLSPAALRRRALLVG